MLLGAHIPFLAGPCNTALSQFWQAVKQTGLARLVLLVYQDSVLAFSLRFPAVYCVSSVSSCSSHYA